MKRKDKILPLLKQQLPSLKQNFKVKSIGIFGSYAREEQTEKSNIGLLVESGAPVVFFKFTDMPEKRHEAI
ncbi:Uncharacterised protein [uncultured archaeon]|nr:Uncharacterised protein [uncultured archaeon]